MTEKEIVNKLARYIYLESLKSPVVSSSEARSIIHSIDSEYRFKPSIELEYLTLVNKKLIKTFGLHISNLQRPQPILSSYIIENSVHLDPVDLNDDTPKMNFLLFLFYSFVYLSNGEIPKETLLKYMDDVQHGVFGMDLDEELKMLLKQGYLKKTVKKTENLKRIENISYNPEVFKCLGSKRIEEFIKNMVYME
eukprot:GAHX01001408.1.p1 GENE.GAHX01001408.1~~GAHX01001408.1.p1  ORF type:complete len:194 (-),score=36.89 GAHX01001408.1:56-637(-)